MTSEVERRLRLLPFPFCHLLFFPFLPHLSVPSFFCRKTGHVNRGQKLAYNQPMPNEVQKPLGKVYLVGAGPGDPELITVRGMKVLALADLVLYDYLVNAEVLAHVRAEARLVSLGHTHGGRGMTQEEVQRRMVEAAREGKTVVRLKSGDPNLFGRGFEEIAALTAAGIEYEVVPGVTAALAAASHAGVSLTHRDCASAVAPVTGHQRADKTPLELDYEALARFPGTLVFYMGVTTARQWSAALIDKGRSPDASVVIVRRVTWPDQQVIRCTLGTVADVIEAGPLRPPAVIIVGSGAE